MPKTDLTPTQIVDRVRASLPLFQALLLIVAIMLLCMAIFNRNLTIGQRSNMLSASVIDFASFAFTIWWPRFKARMDDSRRLDEEKLEKKRSEGRTEA